MTDDTKRAIVAIAIIAGSTVAAICFHRAAILWFYLLAPACVND